MASGVFDIEDNEMTPGSGVVGEAINHRLTGDGLNVATVPAATVVGVLRERLVPLVAPLTAFGTLEGRYRFGPRSRHHRRCDRRLRRPFRDATSGLVGN